VINAGGALDATIVTAWYVFIVGITFIAVNQTIHGPSVGIYLKGRNNGPGAILLD